MQAQTQIYSQTLLEEDVQSRSKEALISDIQTDTDGGYLAESARKLAVKNQQIDVITAGLTARSYNTRGQCLASLTQFPASQQKAALATALGDNTAWNVELIGENRAAQMVLGQKVADILKGFGINATWRDLLNPASRISIVNQLAASQ